MKRNFIPLLLLVTTGLLMAGCVGVFGMRKCERSSSIADYLFPKEQRAVEPSVPVLALPLKVGVAFVPPGQRSRGDFSEMQKQVLLEKVASSFRSQKFVESVQPIPAGYLRREGSFDNLDQLKRMLGIDVVILLSYDQIQFTDDNLLSLTYWTIVGAYVFHGNKNDTHTLVEAVVYDINSRSLLFRAPGSNQTRRGATGVGLDEFRRRDAAASLELATADLIKNLDMELLNFRTRVKEGTANVRIEHRAGYSGGGSADWLLVGLLGLGAGVALLRRRA
jgi:rhombotail lipoprotein